MDLSDIPLFSMLRGRLSYLSDRQKVIAENVANADTPGYAPRDLKPFSFQAQMQAQGASQGLGMTAAGGGSSMAVTSPGHMLPPHAHKAGAAKPVPTKDSETTLDGNSVVLEEEMLKMGQARMDYDAAIGFYQKSLNLIRLAVRAPGHG
ncbi:flagellar basal body rod protein FlgB [Phenylobacterium soli]|uniref:Flagellar basal body rod protein FlgB n=1 Tax=Phenylobacterium soli TaxID=2170551 RepID=A0A328AKV5_9CAUL|nr:flagellar basal body rod protein FlgB [Phenylobacterium soli]RAK54666.1 flagellar basal body rod protein FlgB [Phenylobacterium soli]